MSDSFVFGGISSLDYNALLLSDDMTGTEYDYAVVSVPGRSGDLHRGNNRYKNKNRDLVVYVGEDAHEYLDGLNSAFLSVTGYARLQSTINPDWYTLGQYVGNIQPRKSAGYVAGRVTMTFDCKPQKWLVEGDNEVLLEDGDTIENPTRYPAKPLLYVTGSGEITIGRYTIEVLEDVDDMVIDCDVETAYSSETGESYNAKIRTFSTDFLQIEPGENTVAVAAGMTLTVVPKWWTL